MNLSFIGAQVWAMGTLNLSGKSIHAKLGPIHCISWNKRLSNRIESVSALVLVHMSDVTELSYVVLQEQSLGSTCEM